MIGGSLAKNLSSLSEISMRAELELSRMCLRNCLWQPGKPVRRVMLTVLVSVHGNRPLLLFLLAFARVACSTSPGAVLPDDYCARLFVPA